MEGVFSTPRPWRISVSGVTYIRHGRGVQTRRAWRREFLRGKMEIEAWEKQNLRVGKWDSPPNPRLLTSVKMQGIRAEKEQKKSMVILQICYKIAEKWAESAKNVEAWK